MTLLLAKIGTKKIRYLVIKGAGLRRAAKKNCKILTVFFFNSFVEKDFLEKFGGQFHWEWLGLTLAR